MYNAQNAATDSRWSGLYKAGGVSALVTALIILATIIAFTLWPPPDTVIGHFTQFQSNWFVGLLGMDFLYLLTNIVMIPAILALYVALRQTNESLMLMGLAFFFVGLVALIPARPVFEMQALSEQYAAATTEAQRTVFLTAGEALWAAYYGTPYHLHLIIGSVALIIISVVMLWSNIFSRATAYMGIAANVLALGFYVPVIGLFLLFFSVLFYWIWCLLVARRLLQLGRREAKLILQQS